MIDFIWTIIAAFLALQGILDILISPYESVWYPSRRILDLVPANIVAN